MASCGECIYFTADAGYHLIYDGYCSLLSRGVNRSNSCNNFSQKSTAANSGFKGGCFLTSACTEYLGKPDDCEELTKLRAFRDGYMKSSDIGIALVGEYYRIAPEIVEKINNSGKKNEYYNDIYRTIQLCIKSIDGGDNEEALSLYRQMVEKYKKQFSI